MQVCFFIMLQAVKRIVEGPNEELTSNGWTILVVAGVGLVINAVGLLIFGKDKCCTTDMSMCFLFAGSKGGHNHKHSGHSHDNADENAPSSTQHHIPPMGSICTQPVDNGNNDSNAVSETNVLVISSNSISPELQNHHPVYYIQIST